ncbi:transcription factor bHLH148-like [Nymphaea colorata]|nr:transcription factor bHLH148-like [Nymphaea colorata]
MDVNRRAMSARNTVSYLQWLLPAIGEATQQQVGIQGSVVQRGKMIKTAADMGLAQSSNGRQYHWCRALRLRLRSCRQKKALQTRRLSRMLVRKRKPMASLRRRRERSLLSLKGRESEKEGMERRVRALKRLVPGGEGMALERLFEEAADYIMALQGQVTAMKALASFFDSVGDEKTMMNREPC